MPILSNRKHELFAQGLAKGMTQEAAYAKAGFSPQRSNAARLIADDSIKARVAELQGKAAEKTIATREWILEQLIDNVRRAKEGDKIDGATANKALELLGKEQGMFVERTENLNANRDITNEPLTEDEWAEQAGATH